ncbi:MAG TPA: nucleotidyltransferase family protein [Ktedonobacterales bacterium]|nr:nucleotidyltransferase family protein [Ktedonobacterales bacterium]
MGTFLTGLVLAAGSSKRLGQPKQLLPFRGTTLLGWTLAQAEASPALDEVLVILGHASETILASVTLRRARPVLNPEFGEGCAASYRTGLAAADPRAAGVMILLSDQPGVDVEAIGRVAAAWRAAGGSHSPMVVASYQGVPGHPLLFDRQLFPDLAALHGDKAAWKLIDQHPDWVQMVEIGRPLPKDVDTWADYTALTD